VWRERYDEKIWEQSALICSENKQKRGTDPKDLPNHPRSPLFFADFEYERKNAMLYHYYGLVVKDSPIG